MWRSLRTFNEQTAIDLGRRLLFQLEQRAELGLPPKSKLFAAVIDDYIRYRERDHHHGKTSAGPGLLSHRPKSMQYRRL